MSWHLLKDFRPKGHAYFVDESGACAIADCSGNLPQHTDEGVLYVDFSRPLIAERVHVPLNGGKSTPATTEEARWLSEEFEFGRHPEIEDDGVDIMELLEL